MKIKEYSHKLYKFRSGIISLEDYISLPECYVINNIQIAYTFDKAYKIVEDDFENLFEEYKKLNGIVEDPDFEIMIAYMEDVYPHQFLLLNPPMIEMNKAKTFVNLLSRVLGFDKSNLIDYGEVTDEIYDSIMEGEELFLLRLRVEPRNIQKEAVSDLYKLINFYQSLNFKERMDIEPGGILIGPKYIDLVDRFFSSHDDCISFFVNAGKRVVASNDGKCLACLERTSSSKWTYTLQWEDGKYVGEYLKPFKPTYENYLKFNIGAKILADQLRYYIWVEKPERVKLVNNIFSDLTFQ